MTVSATIDWTKVFKGEERTFTLAESGAARMWDT